MDHQINWPTHVEYSEVVVYPETFISDPELSRATVELKPSGLPFTWAGQLAAVFKLCIGSKKWAVRCFTSQIRDQQARYAALYQAAHSADYPSCLVDFVYLPKGIRIAETWYPLIKMEWAEGQTLDKVVEQCISSNDRDHLNRLAESWIAVIEQLHACHFAHGDLQHENILVQGAGIKLVDYDGFYVPALKGRDSLENGWPHYQHPKRCSTDFNETLDNFSALVIYLSLRALAVDPTLWNRYHDDKRLIFSKEDYDQPQQSALIQELRSLPDLEINKLANELTKACQGPLSSIPNLENILKVPLTETPRRGMGKAPDWVIENQPAPHRPVLPTGQRRTNGPKPSWMDDAPISPAAPKPAEPEKRRPGGPKPSWMDENSEKKL